MMALTMISPLACFKNALYIMLLEWKLNLRLLITSFSFDPLLTIAALFSNITTIFTDISSTLGMSLWQIPAIPAFYP